MAKYQNNKILKQPITAALNGEDELALLLTGSKKLWIYQLWFFIISLRYFVGHDSNSWSGNFAVVLITNFFPDWETEFLKQLGHTDICQEIDETDA